MSNSGPKCVIQVSELVGQNPISVVAIVPSLVTARRKITADEVKLDFGGITSGDFLCQQINC
jgi:hypothetical protein